MREGMGCGCECVSSCVRMRGFMWEIAFRVQVLRFRVCAREGSCLEFKVRVYNACDNEGTTGV